MKRLLVILAAATLLCVVMGACGSKPEYDPSQYVTLDYLYFNGEGVAVPVVTPPDAADQEAAQIAALLEGTTFRYSPDNKLSNGDVVTVTPTYDEATAEKKGFKPVVKEVKFTVEGLPEGTPVDLWESIDVLMSGKDTVGKFDIFFEYPSDNEACTKFLSNHVNYNRDKYKDLSNGDVVTVSVTYNKEEALINGYKIISEPTKEFTVSGLK